MDKTLVILGVKDEKELLEFKQKLIDNNFKFIIVDEPDRNNEFTALACFPTEDNSMFKEMKLI